jgi:hypothetical protein
MDMSGEKTKAQAAALGRARALLTECEFLRNVDSAPLSINEFLLSSLFVRKGAMRGG